MGHRLPGYARGEGETRARELLAGIGSDPDAGGRPFDLGIRVRNPGRSAQMVQCPSGALLLGAGGSVGGGTRHHHGSHRPHGAQSENGTPGQGLLVVGKRPVDLAGGLPVLHGG